MSKAQALFDIDIDDCQENTETNNQQEQQDDTITINENGVEITRFGSGPIVTTREITSTKIESNIINITNNNNNKTEDIFRHKLAINVQNVAFQYKKGKPVLKNINLLIPEGKFSN